MPPLFLRSRRVVAPEGLRPAGLLIDKGVIQAVLPPEAAPPGSRVVDEGDKVLLPGLVDTHVHVNEPGRTEWEGFASATRAAAAGGVTTIVDMPLNCSPVTTTAAALETKLKAAEGRLTVDCAFWGGVVPGNSGELAPMIALGAAGFKAFLVHSGIDDFPAATEDDLRRAMPILARKGVPLLVHAELAGPAPSPAASRGYAGYLASRPKAWENEAVRLVCRLAGEYRCRVHIVHLSSAEALDVLGEARRKGVPVTAETCPHYLTFDAESVPDGATEYKCSPPIREAGNRERLWRALGEGAIDFVVSDHSPCVPELKARQEGDFMKAWGGIASLQFGLPAVWTGARGRGFGLQDLVEWMSRRPAAFAGLDRKGRLAAGSDADVAVLDPDARFTVEAEMIQHRHKLTPYAGRELQGRIEAAYVGGVETFRRGTFAPPSGRALRYPYEQLH